VKATTEKITSIKLTFNEAVSSIDTVKIGTTNYTPVVTGKTATISVDLDATKAYDVTVVNATDAAGNIKDVQHTSLSVSVDNVAPSITSVVSAGEDKVKVTLDKELKDNSLVLTGKVGSFTTNIVSDVDVNPENKKEYIVTLNNSYLFKNGSSDTVTLTVAKEALVDSLGNKNAAEITKTVVVSKDTVAPAVSNVETTVTNGKVTAFTVTYTEEVTSLTASKIYVVNSKGEILSLSDVAAPAIKLDDHKKVVFTLESDLKADKYSFDLAEGFVTDKSLAANKSAKYAFTVDVTDAATPVETTFTIVDATEDQNVVTVNFGAKVKATGTGSALNPASYQINGVALPADTKIEFKSNLGVVDQSTVVITLPAGFVKTSDTKAIFRVTGVQTLDNKTSNPFIKTIDIEDNAAPEVKSFVATDLDEITVTYSEAIDALAVDAVITDEVKLYDSKGAAVAITSASVVEGKLVLAVTDATAVSKLTTVETADTVDIVDLAKNGQKFGLTIAK
jgi:trimeric autotransporter adhesin